MPEPIQQNPEYYFNVLKLVSRSTSTRIQDVVAKTCARMVIDHGLKHEFIHKVKTELENNALLEALENSTLPKYKDQ